MAQLPGDSALAVALEQLNKPYVYNTDGPNTFDCSGLLEYSYRNGPGIDIGRDTTAQWSSPNMTTVYDALTPGALNPSTLEDGDCLYYFIPGNSGPNAHCKMYAGSGSTIEAPGSGGFVMMNPLDLQGTSAEPFRGVRRALAGGTPGGSVSGSNSGQGSGTLASTAGTGKYWQLQAQTNQALLAKIQNEPRDNRPFSTRFPGGFSPAVQSTKFNPNTGLIRGGMAELEYKMFKCYFMMNPSSIDDSLGIQTSQTSPLQLTPEDLQIGGNWVSNVTVSFSLYFNRMYEVWQGGVKGPNGGPGPSDLGVRWDIRALERLAGMFDAFTTDGGNVGYGLNEAGGYSPQSMPLQIVFGGPNSMQFIGVLASVDYTYTMFDANMVPTEAEADISVMRVYQPSMSSADLVNTLITTTGQTGVRKYATNSFNAPVLTPSQIQAQAQ